VGADGGWWISLLAERENTMPPQYALFNETANPPTYSNSVVELVAILEINNPSSPEVLKILCDWGITHIYIGQSQGETGAGAIKLYEPQDFLDISPFELVYHQDRVYIFTLQPTACQ
jgi:hypothetical protein